MKLTSITSRVGVVTVGTALLIALAFLWSGPHPATALADHKGKPHGKGNDGRVGGDVSGLIFCEITFDDRSLTNDGVEGDRLEPYVDGADRAEMRIGRNRTVQMDFNTHKKKASLRTLHFPGGFPAPDSPAAGCDPSGTTTPAAGINSPTIALAAADAKLVIGGEDHDDTPVGCQRWVNAVLTVEDDNGQTWVIHFGPRPSPGGAVRAPCGSYMVVERLPDTGDGKSQWTFSTSGFAYVYRDNNPPHAATEFWGTVTLPMSGTITSLSDETAPTDCSTCNTYGDGVFPGGCP